MIQEAERQLCDPSAFGININGIATNQDLQALNGIDQQEPYYVLAADNRDGFHQGSEDY